MPLDVATLAHSLHAEVVETHISWILLAGEFAYKIKQPVRLPFVDYSSLDSRRRFCEEEVRLNRALAPSIYLNVVPVTASPGGPVLSGGGATIDYAVRMRRFPDGALFSERLAAGSLQTADIDALARLLARFHDRAPAAPAGGGFGSASRRRAAALAALEGIGPFAAKPMLERWVCEQADRLETLWEARAAGGRVRECHGDLHLSNIIRLGGDVAAFDCIEFDPALRFIDVLDDLAFAVMDFDAAGRGDFAFRLPNLWLDLTGDHGALPALRFAVVYRALVRAHVEGLQGNAQAADRYARTALAWTRAGPRRLSIMHGLPGSGKTHVSQRLLETQRAIRLRSDVERKRLFGLRMHDDSRALGVDLYGAAAGERTYRHLLDVARMALEADLPVILDAAFLRRDERQRALAVAREHAAAFEIIVCEAPPDVLRRRLQARGGDASEADVQVLEQLRATAQPLDGDELPVAIRAADILART